MTVTFITAAPIPAARPLREYKPHDLAETASRLAVELAERPRYRVLLLTGVTETLVKQHGVARKPGAVRVNVVPTDWKGLHAQVAEFSKSVNDKHSKAWAAGGRFQPVIVLNDADYFLADQRICGAFTTQCSKSAAERVEALASLVAEFNGVLLVMAHLTSSRQRWDDFAQTRGWASQERRALFDPSRYLFHRQSREITVRRNSKRQKQLPRWCHPESDLPPSTHPFGPLSGSKKDLAKWMSHDGSCDHRRLERKVESRVIWVKIIHSRLYEAWFRTRRDLALANARKLEQAQSQHQM